MACDIVQGYEILCRDSVGGIKEVYITEFENVPQANITAASGVISAISCNSGTKFYTYQLERENAQYDNNQVGSLENGTNFWESTLTFTMKKMSASMKNSLRVLSENRLMVIVKDANDVYWLMGQTRGVDLLSSTMTSGRAMGDLNGATLTFTGKEPAFDNQVTSSLISALLTEA